jgi:DNA-binding NtrC family response regulator
MSSQARILLVEDDRDVISSLTESLASQDYEVDFAEDLTTARALLAQRPPGLVLLDIHLPGAPRGGLDLLAKLRESHPDLPVIMVSGKDSKQNLLEAGALGVKYFLSKGEFGEKELFAAIGDVLKRPVDTADPARQGVARLLGESLAMRQLKAQIQRYAPLDMPVMIMGPTGSGKEEVARALHEEAPGRGAKPLVVVNCAAIPESIMESHLFGHKRGSFTGATHDHVGLIRQAEGGTLFLDEIGELSPAAQQRFLRFLETGEVQPVGDRGSFRVQTRVLTASHQELDRLVALGRFREDLWFRIHVLSLTVPALKERPEDLPVLCRHFQALASARNHLPLRELSREAERFLAGYSWPGNLRELRNIMFRVLAGTSGPVTLEELKGLLVSGGGASPISPRATLVNDPSVGFFPQSVEEIQPLRSWRSRLVQTYVQRALDLCGGNVTRASEILQVDRTTLYAYMVDPHENNRAL